MKFRSGLLRRLSVYTGSALFFAGMSCQANPLGVATGSMQAGLQYRQPGEHTGCTYNGSASGGCSYTNATGFLPYNSSHGDQWESLTSDLSASVGSSVDTQGLHAQVSLQVSNEPLDPTLVHYWGSDGGEGTATATLTDTLTISGSTPAYLVIGYSLDGSLSASATAEADITESYSVYDYGSGFSDNKSNLFSTLPGYGSALNGPQTYLNLIPVTAGDQIYLSLQLKAHIASSCQAFTPILCTTSVSADASHTLAFTEIGFQDGEGNWISGDTITSASGFDYNVFRPVSSAPEPGSMAYGVLFLIAGAGWKLLQRRGQRLA